APRTQPAKSPHPPGVALWSLGESSEPLARPVDGYPTGCVMADPLQPLAGLRVLVTRPRHQAAGLVARPTERGAVAASLPVVEIRDPPDWGPVDDALARLRDYQWVAFTGVNAVRSFMGRLRRAGREPRELKSARLAAIGPGTAAALR